MRQALFVCWRTLLPMVACSKKAPLGAFLLANLKWIVRNRPHLEKRMSRAASHKELEALITPVVESFGLELWGHEYTPFGGSALVRVFVDGPNGVTLDDCAQISDQLSALFDVEDPIPVAYRLEVSSPGLDRVLFRPEQYGRYLGERLKLRLRWPVAERRNWTGVLRACEGELVRIEVDGEPVEVPLEAVQRARLVYTGELAPRRSDD